MLIRAYGEFWNPDIVEWGSRGAGNRGELLGRGKWHGTIVEIDSWEQHGIYVLLDEFRPVYVGKAFGVCLGPRVRNHLADLAGRWNMFSWYGIDTVRSDGSLRAAGTRQFNPETIIDALEAIAILISDPPLNRKRETLRRAILVDQLASAHPQSIRHYLQQILERLPAPN
jgi:hypothetical protein